VVLIQLDSSIDYSKLFAAQVYSIRAWRSLSGFAWPALWFGDARGWCFSAWSQRASVEHSRTTINRQLGGQL